MKRKWYRKVVGEKFKERNISESHKSEDIKELFALFGVKKNCLKFYQQNNIHFIYVIIACHNQFERQASVTCKKLFSMTSEFPRSSGLEAFQENFTKFA